MADEATAPEETLDTPVDTDTPEAPETDTPSENGDATHDWETRYNDLRPEYDRSQQIIAALQGRHGDEAQARAAAAFGFEFDEDEPESDEYVAPDDRIDQLERHLLEKEQEAEYASQEAAEQSWLEQNISALEKSKGVELDERERDLLVAFATSHRFDDGQPDLEGGYEILDGSHKAAQERYLASKKAPKVPAGSAGNAKYDPNDADQRIAATLAAMEQAESE